jgi:hypothetical protein
MLGILTSGPTWGIWKKQNLSKDMLNKTIDSIMRTYTIYGWVFKMLASHAHKVVGFNLYKKSLT